LRSVILSHSSSSHQRRREKKKKRGGEGEDVLERGGKEQISTTNTAYVVNIYIPSTTSSCGGLGKGKEKKKGGRELLKEEGGKTGIQLRLLLFTGLLRRAGKKRKEREERKTVKRVSIVTLIGNPHRRVGGKKKRERESRRREKEGFQSQVVGDAPMVEREKRRKRRNGGGNIKGGKEKALHRAVPHDAASASRSIRSRPKGKRKRELNAVSFGACHRRPSRKEKKEKGKEKMQKRTLLIFLTLLLGGGIKDKKKRGKKGFGKRGGKGRQEPCPCSDYKFLASPPLTRNALHPEKKEKGEERKKICEKEEAEADRMCRSLPIFFRSSSFGKKRRGKVLEEERGKRGQT